MSCKKFIETISKNSVVFNSLSDENKECILNYFSSGKGVIPCKKIKSHEDLKCVQD